MYFCIFVSCGRILCIDVFINVPNFHFWRKWSRNGDFRPFGPIIESRLIFVRCDIGSDFPDDFRTFLSCFVFIQDINIG